MAPIESKQVGVPARLGREHWTGLPRKAVLTHSVPRCVHSPGMVRLVHGAGRVSPRLELQVAGWNDM